MLPGFNMPLARIQHAASRHSVYSPVRKRGESKRVFQERHVGGALCFNMLNRAPRCGAFSILNRHPALPHVAIHRVPRCGKDYNNHNNHDVNLF